MKLSHLMRNSMEIAETELQFFLFVSYCVVFRRHWIYPIWWQIQGGSVEQADRPSPATARVPNSRLSYMWVSWSTKRSMGRFFSGFLLFSTATNFIPSFFHTLHILSDPVIVLQAWSAGILVIHTPSIEGGFISSLLSTRPCIGDDSRETANCDYISPNLPSL